MELRHLEHFVAVAEELSFTRAAHRVHIAQSALSASIRHLERDLGTELFRRTGHSVLLTESGTVLLAEARGITRTVAAARDAVAAVEGGLRGRVRVGILQSLALGDLARVLVDFHARRPHVRIETRVEPAGSAELVRAVRNGHLDVAFVGLAADYPSDVEVAALTRETLALAVPRDHPLHGRPSIDVDDLDGESFVDYPPGWGIRRGVDELFADRGLGREIVVEVADCRTAFELALAGLGVAFVIPSTLDARDVALHQVTPAIPFEVSIVTGTRPRPHAATRAFVDLVRARFDREPGRVDRIATGDSR